jgi:hypothetical protein
MQYLYNVVAWHLFFMLPQWCFALPPCGEATWHKEMWIRLKHFLASEWENLWKEFFCEPKLCQLVRAQSFFPNLILQLTNTYSTI